MAIPAKSKAEAANKINALVMNHSDLIKSFLDTVQTFTDKTTLADGKTPVSSTDVISASAYPNLETIIVAGKSFVNSINPNTY